MQITPQNKLYNGIGENGKYCKNICLETFFVVQVCKPMKQKKAFILTGNEDLVGTSMMTADVADIFIAN